MGMFSSIFGSDEAGEAAGVRSAGAKEGRLNMVNTPN